MVYSFQDEFGANKNGQAQQLWHSMQKLVTFAGIGERMGSYEPGLPSAKPALQAADIFAYELCHEFENLIKRPGDKMRWPLRQILRMYKVPIPFIRLFDRAELLRITSEAGFPDQTGTREVRPYQQERQRRDVNKWMNERAQFRDGTDLN